MQRLIDIGPVVLEFVCGFHLYGDVTIADEGLQILTYARSQSSEGFLACNTYCDTGHPFLMVIVTLTPI